MATHVQGKLIEVKPNSTIEIESWRRLTKVVAHHRTGHLHVLSYDSPVRQIPVHIEITGRTLQRNYVGRKVRIKITFIGNNTQDTYSRGWLFL